MEEGFGDNPPSQASPSGSMSSGAIFDDFSERNIPDMPLSNPVRESLGTDFPLSQSILTVHDSRTVKVCYGVNPSIYRMFVTPFADRMSTFFIPIPIAHFQVRLRLPLDTTLVDFLVYVRAQPAQIHPNAVRNMMALIVFCHQNNIEFTHKILRMFFYFASDG